MWCKSMTIIANGTNAGESAATRTKETLPETCIIDLHEKFDASSSQFLAPKQLCTVRVTCQAVSITCKKLVPEKTCITLTNTRASFLYQTTYTSFWYKFLRRVSLA